MYYVARQNAYLINKKVNILHVSVSVSQTIHCKPFAAHPAHIFGLLTFIHFYLFSFVVGLYFAYCLPALVLADSFKQKQHPLASKHLLNVTIVRAG